MNMPEIASIETDAVIHATPVLFAPAATPRWNISRINAPNLWSAGIDGTGSVVASFDTGVDVNHPDLKYRWRGGACGAPPDCPSWFDPYNHTAVPYGIAAAGFTPLDYTHVHGTHVMGIMAGGSASGTDAIGVAPGARWISAKIFDDSGNATTSNVLSAFQWALAPAGDAANAPDVVNNSWEIDSPNTCDTSFQAAILVLKAAGIEVVFAAGDADFPPAGPSSSVSPANNAGVFAVGATNIGDVIAPYSALGPSPLFAPPTPDAGCNGGTFPNLVAPGGVSPPGAGIYSSVPVGSLSSDWWYLYGTSAAAPHVSGAAALLAGAMPAMTPAQIETAFQSSATPLPLGASPPNNTYGYGLLNAQAAYQYAFTNFGPGSVPRIAGLPSSVYFINTTTGSFTVVIANQGFAPLTISTISLGGSSPADFHITNDGCSNQTKSSLSSCSITGTFSGSGGPSSALLSIPSNDGATPVLNIPLRANDPVARAQGTGIIATYANIQTAVDNSASWDTIQMQAGTFPESPVFDLPLSLQGGYDTSFGSQTGLTTVQGNLTFSHGTVFIENVTVQGTLRIGNGAVIVGNVIMK
jgi:subtilisin family serine protease